MEIKVAEPRKWRLKHNVIWEQVNGPIPKSHVVVFMDQDKLNLDISNLTLIHRRELLTMNNNGLFTDNADLTELGTNVAKLINATNSKRKKKK